MTRAVMELRNVSKVYGAGDIAVQVLFDVSLDIQERSFVSIIGPSGSGKSTLMNVMGTLDVPTSGSLIVDGRETAGMSKNTLAALRNRTIGFIFQFHFLLPEFTAIENILLPHRIKTGGQVIDAVRLRAEELCEIMGLSKVKDNLAGKMSGGQQQRTAIARALINDPKIVLADEPTGNLDSESTNTVYELLRQINTMYGTTFVIVTHDRKIAERTDRIIEIVDGRVNMDVAY